MSRRWIAVSTRLPNNWQEVLIAWSPPRKLGYTGDVHEATFRVWSSDKLMIWDQGTSRWVVGHENAPTHWAEMPAPPTEGK